MQILKSTNRSVGPMLTMILLIYSLFYLILLGFFFLCSIIVSREIEVINKYVGYVFGIKLEIVLIIYFYDITAVKKFDHTTINNP